MKLTNQMRETVLANAMGEMNKGFSKELAELKKRENKLAITCYKTVFTDSIIRKAKGLPEGWLRVDRCLRFNVNGLSINLNVEEGLVVPSGQSYSCNRLGSITGDIADQVMSYVGDKTKLEEKNKQIRAKLGALLNNCTTLKILEATWPEGKPFYKYLLEAEKKSGAGLPAVLISDINTALGLK